MRIDKTRQTIINVGFVTLMILHYFCYGGRVFNVKGMMVLVYTKNVTNNFIDYELVDIVVYMYISFIVTRHK